MDFWVATADRSAWRTTSNKLPTIVLVWRGEMKIKDARIFAKALNRGEHIRIVSDRPLQERNIEAVSANSDILMTGTTEDRALTIAGCYTHYYTEFLRPLDAER